MEIRDIEKLAKLARIELTDAEKQAFATDLENILHYVDQIKEAPTKEATLELGSMYNRVREDVVDESRTGRFTEKILAEAPETQDGFIKVKKIL